MSTEEKQASVGELLKALTHETGTLVRQEVQLAGTEMRQKAERAAADFGTIALGGAIGHAGLLVLLGAAVVGLSQWVALWAAALIIGGITFLGGIGLLMSGLAAIKKLAVTPERTLTTLREDKAWLKEQFP